MKPSSLATTAFDREGISFLYPNGGVTHSELSCSLSLHHRDHPFEMWVNGEKLGVEYWPGDSKSGMFGGNSNWRGPIWLATNFLLIESLQRFHQYYGPDLMVRTQCVYIFNRRATLNLACLLLDC